MIKEEIAPGIIVYDNVIPNSNNLYQDIEEAMASAKIKWFPAHIKSEKEVVIDYKTRDTSTIGIPYHGCIKDTILDNVTETFFINLNNLFLKILILLKKIICQLMVCRQTGMTHTVF